MRPSRGSILAAVIAAGVAAVAIGPAGSEEPAHDAHHGAAAPADRDAPGEPSRSGPAMSSKGNRSAGPAYPSLMTLPEWTAPQRLDLAERSAHRIGEGEALLREASGILERAIASGDHESAARGLQTLRQASAQLASGIALHRATSASLPEQVALDWYRSQGVAPGRDPPHGVFGLTWFHYLAMTTLTAFALALLGAHVLRMRRAAALAAQLVAGQAVLPPLPSLNRAIAPSAPNAWRGPLKVARIFTEVDDVKTFRMVDPGGGPVPFSYLPGQFMTLLVTVAGRPVRRSYTIASPPSRRDYCEITVRRDPQGVVSRYLHDEVGEGSLLEVNAPSGRFTFAGKEADSIVLIAGGVGVTPLMCVVRYLTDLAWGGDIYLLYAARRAADALFRDEIEYLSRRHPNLQVTLIVEVPDAAWPYRTGRVDRAVLAAAIPQIANRHVHLCGPPAMMAAVKEALLALDVPADQIETEAFIGREGPPKPPPTGARTDSSVATIRFVRSRKSARLSLPVLEAAEAVGVVIDYACRAGVCGVCKVKLLTGEVSMNVQDALSDEDRAQGLVLACQAIASSDIAVDA
ncbi:MAG: FAD-binding oxidoreductase [Anaerolineae bacterium]|nr:FAD-binding oxidoreductase [Anaerolineae bacterium]